MSVENYIKNIKMLKEEQLSFQSNSYFYNEDGAYIWGFSAHMIKECYLDDEIDEEPEQKKVLSLSGGIVVPCLLDFGDEEFDLITEYSSAMQLCDSMSGDLITMYSTIADLDGVKKEIIMELNMKEEDAHESPIVLIQDVKVRNYKYLRLFLEMFETFKEGLPINSCKLAVVLFNINDEKDTMNVFYENDWKLKFVDKTCVVGYKNI